MRREGAPRPWALPPGIPGNRQGSALRTAPATSLLPALRDRPGPSTTSVQGTGRSQGTLGLGTPLPAGRPRQPCVSARSSQGPPPPSPTVRPPLPHCPLAPAVQPALPRARSTCDQPGRVTHTCAPRSTHNHLPERTQLQPECTPPQRPLWARTCDPTCVRAIGTPSRSHSYAWGCTQLSPTSHALTQTLHTHTHRGTPPTCPPHPPPGPRVTRVHVPLPAPARPQR